MLEQFRQTTHIFGRTLLGMLLFVWLSMALVPCVMANSVMANSAMASNMPTNDTAALHEKMADCAYCPAEHEMMVLCHNDHQAASDVFSFAIDSIDTESFILFEIPSALSFAPALSGQNLPALPYLTEYTPLPPLALTGILRI
ncbi:MAG TPA: hypothetical protein ENK36_01620 [Desulfobacterales bacterium]|nr:hypothetical protein [Desulfobacterales bacterium]